MTSLKKQTISAPSVNHFTDQGWGIKQNPFQGNVKRLSSESVVQQVSKQHEQEFQNICVDGQCNQDKSTKRINTTDTLYLGPQLHNYPCVHSLKEDTHDHLGFAPQLLNGKEATTNIREQQISRHIHKLQDDKKSLFEHISHSSKITQSLYSLLTQSHEQNDRLTATLEERELLQSSLRQKVDKRNQEVNYLMRKVKQTNSELARAKDRVVEIEAGHSKICELLQGKQKHLETVQQDRQRWRTQAETYSAKIRELQEHLAQSKMQIDLDAVRFSDMEQQIAMNKATIAMICSQRQELVVQWVQVIEKLASTLRPISTAAEIQLPEIPSATELHHDMNDTALNDLIRISKCAKNWINQACVSTESSFSQQCQSHSQTKAQLKLALERADQAESKEVTACQQATQLRQDHEQMQVIHQDRVKQLQEQILMMTRDKDVVALDLDTARVQYATVSKERDNLKAELNIVKTDLQDCHAQLQRANSDLVTTANQLETERASQNNLTTASNKELNELRMLLTQALDQHASDRARFACSETSHKDHSAQLLRHLAAAQKDVAVLKQKLKRVDSASSVHQLQPLPQSDNSPMDPCSIPPQSPSQNNDMIGSTLGTPSPSGIFSFENPCLISPIKHNILTSTRSNFENDSLSSTFAQLELRLKRQTS